MNADVRTTFECILVLFGTVVGGTLVGAILTAGEAAEVEYFAEAARGIALKRARRGKLDGLSVAKGRRNLYRRTPSRSRYKPSFL